jgi:hypothetical protein
MVYSGLAFAWVLMHVSILCMYSKWSTGRQPDNQRQDDTLLLLNDQSGLVLGDSTIFSWAGCHKNDDARLLTLSCACTKRTTKFYVCQAFCAGARQSFMFVMRLVQAHDKVSCFSCVFCTRAVKFQKKYEFFASFYLSTANTLFCHIYLNLVLISIFLLFLTKLLHWKEFFWLSQIWTTSAKHYREKFVEKWYSCNWVHFKTLSMKFLEFSNILFMWHENLRDLEFFKIL